MADLLTILICTHDRADLLERTLTSINAAKRPAMPVRILVAANACTDETVMRMRAYQSQQVDRGWLPLRLIEVPTPGKSHALNQAIPEIDTELSAFVDDDHRIDVNYLVAIEQAAQAWPDAGLYCGRILPDWDGSEPAWVHDEGPYRIYPLPVPRYDQGGAPKIITAEEGPIPGGGNLVVRRRVFEQTGRFSTDLGPRGHDLGGGEDSEYVLRALTRGETCRYAPAIVQYHYVDTERLRLSYLLKKGYQRTRSISRLDGNGKVPLYMWRKVAEYGFHSVFALSWQKRRFYWVRLAAALGEVRGCRESGHRNNQLKLPSDRPGKLLTAIGGLTALNLIVALMLDKNGWALWLPACLTATVGAHVILGKSLLDFSQTGPSIREEVLRHYRGYTLFALIRLTAWSFAILLFLGSAGTFLGYLFAQSNGYEWDAWLAFASTMAGIAGGVFIQFAHKLRHNPGLLIASMHYRTSRFCRLWSWLTPGRLALFEGGVLAGILVLFGADAWRLAASGQVAELVSHAATLMFFLGIFVLAGWEPEAKPARQKHGSGKLPNILMIGSDTLRADRLGGMGYHRALTPNIDKLAQQGAHFSNCYVPCARTAPSLISLLSGTWPHTHGIRDNFISLDEARLKVDALPTRLKPLGYRSAAVSDWCGADMGKFSFGFDYVDLPDDQWNLKYLIRQGPKDLRLFVSLFMHNRLGRYFLPELYYLGGAPLTVPMGKRVRRLVSQLAESDAPFFLNVFYSTTHPPFASEWPWYARYTDPGYDGESKFAMARLTDPFEIIRRQGAPREEFDLDQIVDLYDGCVAQFDDEVGKMLVHLEASGLAQNTIVVVYSDHGMEFFEHDTWGQGNSAVAEASPRIPLVILDPRRGATGRVDSVVRSIDLAPTLLDLVGAPLSGHIDGVSLAACMDRAPCPELDAFNETGIWIAEIPGLPERHLRYPDLLGLLEIPDRESGTLAIKPEFNQITIQAKDRMIRSGRWKLVYQPLEDNEYVLRLFDTAADPNCEHDISGNEPDVTAWLWARLESWMSKDLA